MSTEHSSATVALLVVVGGSMVIAAAITSQATTLVAAFWLGVIGIACALLAGLAIWRGGPLSFAWMHDAIGDEPTGPMQEFEDDEYRAVLAARRARLQRLEAFRLGGGRHVVDLAEDDRDARVFTAIRAIEKLR